ncbi:GNAT domain-containing protein [Aspergillus pseudonomiae]|uniref:GNAT domain-containing protein n=1 Tax=Aspergillus pseudonomiae TaxID=1506151 RepID=A0A5N7D978_9EURO|nr:GNAT domain-containing protein [Aspergillus pseudonomiae]KAB8262454.1 GNAT domain-containing protein [Aspergillus pseudonomiae]KAE8402829.1 GNAT domain-containing protein [Aspergillus pseudonomiae]
MPILPLLPQQSQTPAIHTARLLLRPFRAADLPALHVLRTTPDVMRWTRQGRIDATTEETSRWMERFTHDNETGQRPNYNFAVLRKTIPDEVPATASEEGDLIGIMGIVSITAEDDPEVGYLFLPETWGSGYATEALKGFAQAWWRLPIPGDGVSGAAEEVGTLRAVTDKTNVGSAKVLTKCGWTIVGGGVDGEGEKKVELLHWMLRRPVV